MRALIILHDAQADMCPHIPRRHFFLWHGSKLFIDCLGFNDMSTLVGHFVSSPREREKRDKRDSKGVEREGQGRKRKMNESEETKEIKTFPLYPYLLQGQQALPNCKQIADGRPSDARYTTPLPHPTTSQNFSRIIVK